MKKPIRGALELGGTKAICMVGRDIYDDLEMLEIPTTDPDTTLDAIVTFFEKFGPLNSIGIASFGPLQLDPSDANYGCIINTPKPNWSNVNLREFFSQKLKCAVHIDTDVNAAALAEAKLGRGNKLDNFIYLTIGTGIGGAAFIQGVPLMGLTHPEMGHVSVNRQPDDMHYKSCCPFHTNCIEGLASGKAIYSRWGQKLADLDESHRAWSLQSSYITEFLMSLCLTISPQRIIIGGGVSNSNLLSLLRNELKEKGADYIPAFRSPNFMNNFIVAPTLGKLAGPFGAFLLNETNFSHRNEAVEA